MYMNMYRKGNTMIYNGKIHNRDEFRPAIGITCKKVTIKGNKLTESLQNYKLINIHVHSGKYDSYEIQNIDSGKISNAVIISENDYVSITDFSNNIQSAIIGNIGKIDFVALRHDLETTGYPITRKMLALFDKAKTGNIPAAKELILYMLTSNFSGKMHGMTGISTSVKLNPLCKLNRKDVNSICHECYSDTGMRKSTAYKLALNTLVLCTYEFTDEQIPFLNCTQFRFESFGDLMNVTQAVNYISIIRKNTHVRFGWFTKRPAIMHKAFVSRFNSTKPENVYITYSSKYLNIIDNIFGKFMLKDIAGNVVDMIDHIFTVFTAAYAIAHNIVITCMKKVCVECETCYLSGNPFVNEMLKSQQKEYIEMLAKMKA